MVINGKFCGDGTVVGWGNDFSVPPTAPTNLSNVVAIAAGGFHSLALKRDGTVIGWGNNDYLQATPPANLNKIVGIAGGGNHSLALKANGTVIGWGDNSIGQARPPANLNHVVAIAAGGAHSLALKADGTVIGWGDNSFGQTQPPPQLADVVGIAAGGNHSLALKSDGTVVGWGCDFFGWGVPTPALVGVTDIAVGGSDFLALSILPGTPVRLAARITATNQVDLSWHDKSDDEDSFIIERALDPGFYYSPGQPFVGTWMQTATVGADVTQYQDTSVINNLTYRYRVCAHNQFGNSPASVPVTVNMTPPSAPFWPMAAIGSTNQVDLAWWARDVAVDGFRIERARDAGGNPGVWGEIGVLLVSNTSSATFTDTNVTALTTNLYRLRAFNRLGSSTYCETARVQIVPPPAPYYFSANAFRNRINLSWGGDSYNYGAVSGFRIERAPDVGGSPGNWAQIASIAGGYNSYTHTNRPAGVMYWYRVRAFNWVGNGDYSTTANATITPAAPANLNGRIGTTNQINLLWNESPVDDDGFSVTTAPATGAAASQVMPSPVAAEVRITSLIATNFDVLVVWQSIGGTTNVVEATSSLVEGFTNLSRALPIGGRGLITTNYVDAGGLTNAVQRFYRVKVE